MPYISKGRRPIADKALRIREITYFRAFIPSDIAYLAYKLCLEYYNGHKLSWDIITNGTKALQSAIDEIKRNILVPYEDKKKQENGDVTL